MEAPVRQTIGSLVQQSINYCISLRWICLVWEVIDFIYHRKLPVGADESLEGKSFILEG